MSEDLPEGTQPTEQTSNRVNPRKIEQEMRQSYMDYAMSVIVSRALPDARDGLKPVHRRILYSMGELGMSHTQSYKKSAYVVGEVLGKYHPHGDSSIYDAMVRMAQDWSLRYMLVDGQGNFGSIDGDGAAAMRYTESKLTKISSRMLADLDKETIEWATNYDGRLREPRVLPAAFPNLLVNGSDGIAVGMATKMPPHNLGEICLAATALLENPEMSASDLIEIVPGPDFPTGGVIHGRTGAYTAATTGRGKVIVRGKYTIEANGDRDRIVFHEIPYQQNKANILMHIADLVKDKIIEGISDLRDESDRRGMRMVIELKRDAITEVVLNKLFKFTALQSTFGVNNLALVNGRPLVLTTKRLIEVYLDHRRDVIDRRTRFDLGKAQDRLHIVDGLLRAVDAIDAIIELIRGSADGDKAREALMAQFQFTESQAKAILDMTLRKLTGLEMEALVTEAEDLRTKIAEYERILGDPKVRDGLIHDELVKLREEFGDERRTTIEDAELDVDMEDLIPRQESVYLWTKDGYVKRMPVDDYREQNRGGKGLKGHKAKEEDFVVGTAVGSSHDVLCVFTTKGRLLWIKGWKIPIGSRLSRGKPIQNLVQLQEGEFLSTIIAVDDFDRDAYLFFTTKRGVVKRTELRAYSNIRSVGVKAVLLREEDQLHSVRLTTGTSEILLATALGQACRFNESEVRVMGRTASGVRGISLQEGDEVVSIAIAEEGQQILTVTRNGFGKRTYLDEYRQTKRGAKGVKTITVDERNGPVVAVRTVDGDEGILLVSKEGMVVRTRIDQIRLQGRSTKGVRIMRVAESDVLAQVVVLPASEAPDESEMDAVDQEVVEGTPEADEPQVPVTDVEDEGAPDEPSDAET